MEIKAANRIVVKVGTSTLTHPSGLINIRRIEQFVKVLADLKNMGKEIVLVTSGAIGVGVGKLGLKERPSDTRSKQAAAAIGQCELMYIYDRQFSEYNHVISQVLLTRDVVEDERRCALCRNTFSRLLEYGVVPVVNENDTVAVEEIEFGDNDTLSAVVATLCDADLLIILSDIDGLYTDNPRTNPNATLIRAVTEIDDYILSVAHGAGSARGTGGMITKIHAAEVAGEAGIDTVVMSGTDPALIYRLLEGESVGTRFYSRQAKPENVTA
ncbi:glutamate 5-kinase [Harryflintia acetispora]|uniref:glutamate 5-kinase n=1 Tax=Harryflintia acetispora TaxID=1849041 RepID=UPI00189806F2|nr:glutamate 5-kinase [Harryflintia acetispora]